MTAWRVAYILARYPCLSETFIHREIEAVRQQGLSIDVYALKAGESSAPTGQVSYRNEITALEKCGSMLWAALRPLKLGRATAQIIRDQAGAPIALLKSLRNLPVSAAFARRIRKRGARCIHAHFAGEPAIVARTISGLVTIPYTFSIHAGDIFVDKPPLAGTIRCARAVAACTNAVARRVKELTPSHMHHKLRVVRHGIEPTGSGEEAPSGREALVLTVGRLVEKKGVSVLLQAVKLLREKGRSVDCVILGDGPERPVIERTLHDLGIGDAVRLPGWASPDEVRAWMARAGVLAVPSVIAPNGDRDGLPNVILEAASARLPVVASDVGGIGEFVADERTGLLVPPGDVQALAAAVERMMDDDVLRASVIDAAHQKVTREYDASANARALIESMEWET